MMFDGMRKTATNACLLNRFGAYFIFAPLGFLSAKYTAMNSAANNKIKPPTAGKPQRRRLIHADFNGDPGGPPTQTQYGEQEQVEHGWPATSVRLTVFHLFCLLFKLCVLGVFDVGGAGLERLEFFLLVGCCAQPGAAGRRAEFETIAGVIREHCMCVIYTHVCGVCGFLFCRGAGAFAIADFGGDFVESAGCVGEQRAGELQTYLFCGVVAHFQVVGEAFGEVYVGDWVNSFLFQMLAPPRLVLIQLLIHRRFLWRSGFRPGFNTRILPFVLLWSRKTSRPVRAATPQAARLSRCPACLFNP